MHSVQQARAGEMISGYELSSRGPQFCSQASHLRLMLVNLSSKGSNALSGLPEYLHTSGAHIHTYTHSGTHTHIHLGTHTHTLGHTHMGTHTHGRTRAHTYTGTHTGSHPPPYHGFFPPVSLTRAVVGLRAVAWKVEEMLDPVQGYFGFQETIDHPGEVVERKNKHAHKCQCCKHLRGGEGGA